MIVNRATTETRTLILERIEKVIQLASLSNTLSKAHGFDLPCRVTTQDCSPPSVVRKSFLLRAWQPQAAMPAAKNDASRRRRRGIKHLSSYLAVQGKKDYSAIMEGA